MVLPLTMFLHPPTTPLSVKLGLLFSGGKDSTLAGILAGLEHDLVCLMAMVSGNPDSYMFHTPAMDIIGAQAEALGLPLIEQGTIGEKENELIDLSQLMKRAKEEYGIEGVVTGAVASTYQASRVQRVAFENDLFAFNPLWQMDQLELLQMVIDEEIEVIISGVAAYPLDETWLGRTIDAKAISDLEGLQKQWQINPAGEGGEIETLVLTSPIHTGRLELKRFKKFMDTENSGRILIDEVEVVPR